jgi:GTPase SAR1 family protein
MILNTECTLQWYREVCEASRRDVPTFLVGCKSDFRSWIREYARTPTCLVPQDDAEEMASTICASYYGCSAYAPKGIDELFDAVARASLEVVFEEKDEKRRFMG